MIFLNIWSRQKKNIGILNNELPINTIIFILNL